MARRKRSDLSKHTIENDLYDRSHFESIREESDKLKDAEKFCRGKCPQVEFLSQDFYSALYKAAPQKLDDKLVSHEVEVHNELVKQLLEHKEYEKLRNFTFLDEFASAIGLVPLMKELVSALPDPPPPEPEGGEGDGNGEGDGKSKGKGKGKGKGKPKKQKIDPEKLSQAMEKACKKASKEIDDANSCMNGWGTEQGQIQKLPFKEKMALRDRLAKSEKMKRLAKMVGKASRMALSAQKTKIKHGSDEVFDVEIGNNLAKVLPSELMLLHASEESEMEFCRKFTEGKLMQYKLRSVIKEQKGPIICAIDNSGSMSGEREVWSKAFGLGLLEIAIKQKRKLVILHFGSSRELQRFDFSHNDAPIERKIDCAEFFFGGGTDFDTPLTTSMDIVNEELPKADIVFITDGCCGVEDTFQKEWSSWRNRKEVKCYGVYIDEYDNDIPEILDDLCDKVVHAKDLLRSGEEYQRELYEAI